MKECACKPGTPAAYEQDGKWVCIPCGDVRVLAGWPVLTPAEVAALTARIVAMGTGGQGRLGVGR